MRRNKVHTISANLDCKNKKFDRNAYNVLRRNL